MNRNLRTNIPIHPRQRTGQPISEPLSSPAPRSPQSGSVSPTDWPRTNPQTTNPKINPINNGAGQTTPPHRKSPQPQSGAPTVQPSPTNGRRPRPRRKSSWLTSWHLWSTIGILVFVGSGAVAGNYLFSLPTLPNCAGTFWPLASASKRISCAQELAEKHNAADLLRAIELLSVLPPDHPMRSAIDLHIEQWAKEILDLSEIDFQAGKLNDAINHAQKIPAHTSAHRLVKDRIAQWRKTWARAEEIFNRAEEELRRQDWHQAFWQAVRLQAVGNTYWGTVKYQEFLNNLRIARTQSNQLASARGLAESGSMANILKAIELLNKIEPDSYMYREARKLVLKYSRQLLDMAEATLEGGDLQQAIDIAKRIPVGVNLKNEVQDFIDLAQAQLRARSGSADDLETAISMAQKLPINRPLYNKAQALIARWQLETEAVGHLDRARDLARPGGINDLMAAIAEVQNVPRSNPRWNEVQQEISRWTNQIETIQDKPYLDEANALAAVGDIGALQAAIEQARRIRPGRALYQSAQTKIRDWTAQIETTQDRPYLTQAEQLAANGDYVGAINTAQAIQPGRALYREAQGKIQTWSNQIRARQNLQDAYRVAAAQSSDALRRAIQLANRVPGSTNLRNEADTVINQWSGQLLAMAENQAMYNLFDKAIEIAQSIPPQAEVYSSAQARISSWKQQQASPAPEASPSQATTR